MRKTAIFKDDLFLKHDPGYGHVESPSRLEVIYEQLNKPELNKKFLFPSFSPATREILELNHSEALIERVSWTRGKPSASLDPDTRTSPDSFDAACLAAGAVVDGTKMLFDGKIDNCFALVRPPGHHAEAERAMGFCLFNNVAVAAHYAIQRLNKERILIVDWDLHHGNGTQHSFYGSDQVLYFSTHQYPHYPGTGAAYEVGTGHGEGYTINIPLPGGQDDAFFAAIFNSILAPIVKEYQPECIMVSAGFDIYKEDPLGGMNVTADGFAYMTRKLRALADEVCDGRLLVTLEGGYNLTGLRDGALAVLFELAEGNGMDAATAKHLKNATLPSNVLEETQNIAKKYWKM